MQIFADNIVILQRSHHKGHNETHVLVVAKLMKLAHHPEKNK
jgi:hypothetical protein